MTVENFLIAKELKEKMNEAEILANTFSRLYTTIELKKHGIPLFKVKDYKTVDVCSGSLGEKGTEITIDKELADLLAGYFMGKYEKLRKEFEEL